MGWLDRRRFASPTGQRHHRRANQRRQEERPRSEADAFQAQEYYPAGLIALVCIAVGRA